MFHLHFCYATRSGVARISLVDFSGKYEADHLGTHGVVTVVHHDAEGKATRPDNRAYDLQEQVWPKPRP